MEEKAIVLDIQAAEKSYTKLIQLLKLSSWSQDELKTLFQNNAELLKRLRQEKMID